MRPLLIVLTLALAGCVNLTESIRRSVADKPVPFQDGYVDGCSSGHKASGTDAYKYAKDLDRFNRDRLYRSGWEDGFQMCAYRR